MEARGLWPAVQRATRHASKAGALHSFESERRTIEDNGVCFIIQRLTRAARAEFESKRRTAATSARDPFLPYDPDLFVADVSATHVALLNKFNLLPHHLLIVTRQFKPQDALLDREDITALAAVLSEIDGLIFYNGGAAAGASQPHKHLQVVPLPLGAQPLATPIDAALESVRDRTGIFAVPALAFRHAFSWLPPDAFAGCFDAAAFAKAYEAMLAQIGVKGIERDGERVQSAPWNLLVSRRWMLAAPRAKAEFRGVPINALGFAGSLFVRDDAQLATLKRAGPMAALRDVAGG